MGFSGKSSRASSTTGRQDGPSRDHDRIDVVEVHPDPLNITGIELESVLGDIDPEDYEYTRSKSLGNILLKLTEDNIALARKCNVRGMESNIADLCRDFRRAMEMEQATRKFEIEQAQADEHRRLLERELNSHTINQEIEPPSYFSQIPTLTTPGKITDCMKLFPSRNNKFSGQASDHNMTIVEFLSMMNSAQKHCKLTEAEFLDMLLSCTTGKAHLLIKEWIDNGQSMSSIYHNLTLHFDKRISADQARAQLATYKAPKSSNLAEVTAHIMLLCGRISASMPDPVSRQASYNLGIVNALIKSLPQYSATLVQNTYHMLSARWGRACEATELSRALNIYRNSIDNDIRMHGVDNTAKNRIGRFPFKKQKPTKLHRTSFNVMNVRPISLPWQNRPTQPISNTAPLTGANRVKQGGHNKFGTHKRSRSFNRQPRTNSGCSLCGMKDHTASQGCRNMRTNNGKIYKTMPVHNTCGLCPGNKKNTLNHPPMLCPFRKGGPLEKH